MLNVNALWAKCGLVGNNLVGKVHKLPCYKVEEVQNFLDISKAGK